MDISSEELKKQFPNLADELKRKKMQLKLIAPETKNGREKRTEVLSGYLPDVFDYLRRCSTAEEAKEILIYLEKRGEISKEFFLELKSGLEKKGIRSFGPKKEFGYYLRKYCR